MEAFRKLFVDEYLHSAACVEDLYAEWSRRDPKYFEPIAKPLIGMRCLR